MLTPQSILRVCGIVALVVSALFVVLAVHYYISQNIRAVMDDLSGKARAQGVASTGRSRKAGATAQRSSSRRPAGQGGRAEAAHRPAVTQGEVSPAPMPMPIVDDEDDSGTALVAAASMGTVPAEQSKTQRVAFRVTKRIVHIHSQEVITAS